MILILPTILSSGFPETFGIDTVKNSRSSKQETERRSFDITCMGTMLTF